MTLAEAAIAMLDGRNVRRRRWRKDIAVGIVGSVVVLSVEGGRSVTVWEPYLVEDFKADDWEIVE